jgi:hypothetical protein
MDVLLVLHGSSHLDAVDYSQIMVRPAFCGFDKTSKTLGNPDSTPGNAPVDGLRGFQRTLECLPRTPTCLPLRPARDANEASDLPLELPVCEGLYRCPILFLFI